MLLSIAYYVTGHGLGHATRVIEVKLCILGRDRKQDLVNTCMIASLLPDPTMRQANVLSDQFAHYGADFASLAEDGAYIDNQHWGATGVLPTATSV